MIHEIMMHLTINSILESIKNSKWIGKEKNKTSVSFLYPANKLLGKKDRRPTTYTKIRLLEVQET